MKPITKYNLKEHGFVLVENFYSNKEIESFKFINSDFEYPFQDEEAKGAEITFDFSKVKQYADRLTNKNYHIFLQKINYKSSFVGSHEIYHQDYFYRHSTNIDSEEFLQAFIALEDLNYAPLNVFVGSHKKGLLPHIMCLERNGNAKYIVKKEILNSMRRSFKAIKMKKGSALFFNYKLVHGSGSNASPYNQPRAIIQLCTQKIENNLTWLDRRDFEVNILKKFLDEKL